MVVMDNESVIPSSQSRFVVDAGNVINLRFVDDFTAMDEKPGFSPEFVYQHFGEAETIFGYTDLRVVINYTAASMYVYPQVTYNSDISSIEPDLKPDDIVEKLKEQLPADQLDMMVDSTEAFQAHISKQTRFRPYGELIKKFTTGDTCLELFKVHESSPEFDRYLARVQTLALWYIEGAQYTDNTDTNWHHYFLFETTLGSAGDGTHEYKLAGYCSLYRFYGYPDHVRPRIAQILLLPQYRSQGAGAKLLQSVYEDLWIDSKVIDITVEEPAEAFVMLRDYVDCLNCKKLPEYSKANLQNGFSDSMKQAAQNNFKINRRQARRVYEILRLLYTDVKNEGELKNYRIDVKRRLERPIKKNEKEWDKMTKVLNEEELRGAEPSHLDPEKKLEMLQSLYDAEVESYKRTIERIQLYPSL